MRDAKARRPVRLVPVLLVAVTLIAACAGPAPNPDASAQPSAGQGGLPTATPTATPDPVTTVGSPDADGWSRIALADLPPVATLEAVSAGSGAVAVDTAFRLRSLDGRPPADLARALVAEPPLAFQVVSVDGDTAVVRPEAGLEPNATYRITLARADGTSEAAWVAQSAGPLVVTDTVPGNATTRVPLDTGIEVTFDQYGVTVADFERYFAIAPAVAGHVEALGRSMVFLPDRPLLKGRLYTVTVRRGLPLAGTGEILERDVAVRFETAGKAPSPITAWFRRSLTEVPTTGKARISVVFQGGRSLPGSIPITVHRLEDMTSAVAAWRAIADAPEWTRVSTIEPVPTAGLARVFTGKVPLTKLDNWGTRRFTVPVKLPGGWYVVTERWAGIPRQLLLQVTDLAPFEMVAVDRTAVWVNDVGTGKAVPGATVALGGMDLGRTDDRGLLVATTPAAVASGVADAATLLVVRSAGRAVFRPTGLGGEGDMSGPATDEALGDAGWYGGGWGDADEAWWRLLSTDRSAYRSTDSINAWGVARRRDNGRAPSSVTLVIRADEGEGTGSPPIVTATAKPDANGTFAASMAVKDLPFGDYWLDLVADGDEIATAWLQVKPLTKPAWQMELMTDRRAVISGSTVTATVRARFYEGTPVAGVQVSLTDGDELDRTLATDAFGRADTRVRLTALESCQPCSSDLTAYPVVEEEADLEASSSVDVFAASAMVDVASTLTGTRLRVTGKVSDVVLSRYDHAAPDGDVDARGKGRAGAPVRLRVVEHWTVERKVGTRYDPIAKKVVPVYETDNHERAVADRTVKTTGSGTFSLGLDVRGGRRSYDITAWYMDQAGRWTSSDAWAEAAASEATDGSDDWSPGQPELLVAGSDPGDDGYAVGESVRVRFRGDVAKPRVKRYLYAIAQGGLRYVTVGTTPTFRTTFDKSSLPGIWITGVRFNGTGYEAAVSSYLASANLEKRALTVQVAPDREGYAPGETATVAVRTLGPDGAPVSASVYVKAVDERLYAIDAANDTDPLEGLYEMVGDGVLAVATSHRPVEDDIVDCCDTTGGGEGGDVVARTDFRDSLIATLVTTDRSGRATVSIPVSDDLTAWRVVASAVDGSLRAGAGAGLLTVGLPFFAEATLKDEYLVADRPVIRVRGFGTSLGADDRVTFTISSDTLPMSPVTVRAKAFEGAEVALPKLSPGMHRVRIQATAGAGRADTLVRTFRVIDSRAVRRSTSWAPLVAPTAVEGGSGTTFTRLALVDAGRGRVVPALYDLAWADGGRADSLLAAALANRVLADAFGLEAPAPVDDSALGAFLRERGIALVAHGSAQLDVTALAALTGDPRLDTGGLRSALEAIAFDPDARRDRRLLALAGLAGLGAPVLGEVRAAAARADLTLDEQVTLALAALSAGDEALAGRLERVVLDAHGRIHGPWLRIDTGDAEGDALQTARLAIVSSSLGRPFAAAMDAWLAANLPATILVDLERALAARGWARRVAGASAVAAVTVDGSRKELAVLPGEPATLQLTPAQAASARLEPVSGSVLVVTTRDVPLRDGDLVAPDGVTIKRGVKPAGAIGSTDVVVVTMRVTLAKPARKEGWTVIEWVPSGLSPVTGGSWDGKPTQPVVSPDLVIGQRVEFHVGGDAKVGTWLLRYVARVVTPGTYRWEPAVLQSDIAPDEGIVLPATRVTIRRLGASATDRPSSGASATDAPAPPTMSIPPVPVPTPKLPPSPAPSPAPSPSPPPTQSTSAPPPPTTAPAVPSPTATPLL